MRPRKTSRIAITPWEIALAFLFAAIPLFYKTIYFRDYPIMWEGAYRILQGQVPYRDFHMPLGYGSLILPTLLFKIFAPTMRTLEYAQFIVNFGLGIGFALLQGIFVKRTSLRLISLLVFGLTFVTSLISVWYNTSAFLFELLALTACANFVVKNPRAPWSNLFLGAFLTAITVITKQDYGGLAVVGTSSLIAFSSYQRKKPLVLLIYLGCLFFFLVAMTFPFYGYDFFYQFNLGRPPHPPRITWWRFQYTINAAAWYHRYFFLFVALTLFAWYKKVTLGSLYTVLMVGLCCQSFIVKSLSGLAHTAEFVHAFAVAWVGYVLVEKKLVRSDIGLTLLLLTFFWWGRGVQHMRNAMVNPTLIGQWAPSPIQPQSGFAPQQYEQIERSNLGAFTGLYLPRETNRSMIELKAMVEKGGANPKILNMTELNPLARELGFRPPLGVPLWFHYGTTLFLREADRISHRIEAKEFDWILIQEAHVQMKFPELLWNSIYKNYQQKMKFVAPFMETEVFVFHK